MPVASQAAIPTAPLTAVAGWVRAHLFAIACGIVLASLYLGTFAFKANFEIGLQTFKGSGTYFKVYWASSDRGFSEDHSARIRIRGGDYQLNMRIASLGRIDRLRIDPVEYKGKVTIKYIRLEQRGYDTIQLGPAELHAMQPLNQIASITHGDHGVDIITEGDDGFLSLAISPQANGDFPWIHLLNALLIVAVTVALSGSILQLTKDNQYVLVCLTVAVVVSAVMAAITAIHVHPDERVHLEAIKYYEKHNLPPPLDSPEIVDSFSDYGKSRLSTYEAYYPIAGWFTRALAPLKTPQLLNARLFSVVLFAVLLLIAVSHSRFRYFALPLIVTPQLWYLYSYPNSDVFALTLSLIAGYLFAWKDSPLNQLLEQSRPRYLATGILAFGVLAGLLLMTKVNFYFFLLFLFLYVVWRQAHGDFEKPARIWIRLALIGAVGATMYGGRVALDYAANGPDPKARFNEFIEQYAKPEFRPSTPLAEKHRYLYLRERGKELDVVLGPLRWAGITFATSFGSYGYTQYFGSERYFALMGGMFTLMIGLMIWYGLIRAPQRVHGLILIALGCTGLLVGASIWSSWNENFQAQGRYMAPIVPIIGMVYYHLREYVNPKVIGVIAFFLFVLSLYSFVFIGLNHIGKSSLYAALG